MAALLHLPCGAVAPEVSRAQDSMIRCVLGSRVQQVPAFDVGSIQRLGSLARGVAKGIQRNLSTEAWAQRLSAASGVGRTEQGGVRQRGQEWDTGGAVGLERFQGTRIVYALEEGEGAEGGEDGWLRRADVGEDGYLLGWQHRLDGWLSTWHLDAEGWVVDRRGARVHGTDLAALPVCMRMFVWCRAQLPTGLPIYEGPLDLKREETHINLAESERCWFDLCRYQAQFDITRAFTLDGSLQEVTSVSASGVESKFWVATRAVVDQDGNVYGGRVKEREGADNYLALPNWRHKWTRTICVKGNGCSLCLMLHPPSRRHEVSQEKALGRDRQGALRPGWIRSRNSSSDNRSRSFDGSAVTQGSLAMNAWTLRVITTHNQRTCLFCRWFAFLPCPVA